MFPGHSALRLDNLSLSEQQELKGAAWFQAGIPREISLEVLSRQSPGAFLVRQSSTKPGCFALSLRVPPPSPRVAHYLILRTQRGYKIKVSPSTLYIIFIIYYDGIYHFRASPRSSVRWRRWSRTTRWCRNCCPCRWPCHAHLVPDRNDRRAPTQAEPETGERTSRCMARWTTFAKWWPIWMCDRWALLIN